LPRKKRERGAGWGSEKAEVDSRDEMTNKRRGVDFSYAFLFRFQDRKAWPGRISYP